ncbi:hypothetical protein ZIOFF_058787 [Zingiber officinale]|uniref:RING-type domain-containing protein n=1 Tax=Zingiber officinale TaxID=94328 RepID=A0A8J5F6R4_ZINOF|nr:hypothetical protein ZIOFF_058787 [Zingiber officinale]
MPAQKRPMPPPPPPPLPSDDAPPEPPSQLQQQEDEEEEAVVTAVKEEEKSPSNLPQEQDGSGGHASSRLLSVRFFILVEESQPWDAARAAFVWLRRKYAAYMEYDSGPLVYRFVVVKLADIRKESDNFNTRGDLDGFEDGLEEEIELKEVDEPNMLQVVEDAVIEEESRSQIGDETEVISESVYDDYGADKVLDYDHLFIPYSYSVQQGIIRKTRTVMECLHRFCRACIDKSMRLGNNECPACRTHCASRRSLRDDPNYDALIAALYPDIDKYEEEELSFHEEEMYRNKKLQESIAEIFRRQSEAVGKRKSTAKSTAAAFVRRSQGSYRNYGRGGSCGRDATAASSDDDDDDEANANDIVNNDSSADEPSPDRRPKKRRKRWSTPRSSPAKINAGAGSDDNVDNEANREHIGTSLQAGSRDILAWGKNGARSQTRHGNMSGLNGRMIKGGRITKLVDYLRSLDDNDDELDVYLTLVPLDKERVPNLEQLNLCCRPTLSIRHLCNYIALQTSIPSEEVQIYTRTLECGASATNQSSSMDTASSELFSGLQKLEEQESLLTLYNSFLIKGELVSYCN